MNSLQRCLVALIAVLACAIGASSAAAADLPATPSNFQTVYNGASGGDNVILASGSYGSLTGTTKSSTVTLKPASGAAVSMAGADFNAASNTNITGVTFTQPVCVRNGSTNIDFDTDRFDNLGTGCNEGRLGYIQGATGTVRNSHFGGGGCSDGIQISGGGGAAPHIAVVGNEFVDLRQGNCGPHVDAIQFYGGVATRIDDNYVHSVSTGIMSFDSNGQVDEASNNVLVGDEYAWVLLLSGQHNGTFAHNVVIGEGFRIEGGHQNDPPTNNTVSNSVIDSLELIGGSGNVSSNNLTSSQVTFVGGTGRCAYDAVGTDVGLNDCGGSQPPADADGDGVPDSQDNCPGTPPGTQVDANGCPVQGPTDHQPVAAFTDSPDPSVPQQTVTFDATGSTCEDTPCTYHWHDIGADGTGDWPLGPDGSTMTFAFQGLGTKYVELVLTDADGDVAKIEHDHVVQSAPADTTPPDTSITAQPTNPTTSTSASFSFTGTDNVGVDHFDCRIDGGTYAVCTSPKAYSSLAVGTHTFDVKAVDAAGNADPTAATYTWTINAPASVTPPTFVAEAETSWSTTTSPKSVSLTVQPGDVLVAYTMSEDSPYPVTVTGSPAGASSWTKRQDVTVAGYGHLSMWTATFSGEGQNTATVTFTRAGTGAAYGGDVLQFRGSTGIGASAKANASGAPSLALTTTKDNSAVVTADVDWNAVSGASRVARTGPGAFTEKTYFTSSADYTVYGGYYANVGAIGSKTVGWSAPTGQKYSLGAVEVKGT